MDLQDAYRQMMADHMHEWNAQINLLEAKAKNVAADVRLKHAEEIVALRAKQHSAAKKIKEMENSSGDAWDLVKDTADRMWADLKTGVTEAQAQFE